MLSKKSLEHLRKEIESTSNPFTFYDDDPDGLTSYLLLKKRFEQVSGTIIKGAPALEEKYAQMVQEQNPDKVIILDKPMVEKGFFEGVKRPIIWVDHHDPQSPPKN